MIKDAVDRAIHLQNQRIQESTFLQPDIQGFHSYIIKSLKEFILKAKENGITGVSFNELKDLGEGVSEFSFQLNEENLVFVMRKEVYITDIRKGFKGNNSYIYYDEDSNVTPLIELSIFMNCTRDKFFSVSWFTTEEKKMLTGIRKFDENAGEIVAESIIQFQYEKEDYWKEKPSRMGFSSQKTKKGKLGFVA